MTANHPHQFSDVFKASPVIQINALEMLISNFIELGASSLIFLGIFLVSLMKVLRTTRLDKGSLAQYFVLSGLLVTFPILLTAAMVASHPPIYKIQELWYVFYLPFPIYMLAFAVPYSVYMSDSETKMPKYLFTIAFIMICVSGIYKTDNLYQASCTKVSKVLKSNTCGVNPVSKFKANN